MFLTFSRPALTKQLAEVGRTLDTERREIMLRRELGLTKLYNLVNDPDYTDDDIKRMREIHVELDHAVMDAYGWDDVQFDHGFHTYRQIDAGRLTPPKGWRSWTDSSKRTCAAPRCRERCRRQQTRRRGEDE